MDISGPAWNADAATKMFGSTQRRRLSCGRRTLLSAHNWRAAISSPASWSFALKNARISRTKAWATSGGNSSCLRNMSGDIGAGEEFANPIQRSFRTLRKDRGPCSSDCFRASRCAVVAFRLACLSIVFEASSSARAALPLRVGEAGGLIGRDFPRPNCTKRRTASGSEGQSGWHSAQRTILALIWGAARNPIKGSLADAARGRLTDFAMLPITI